MHPNDIVRFAIGYYFVTVSRKIDVVNDTQYQLTNLFHTQRKSDDLITSSVVCLPFCAHVLILLHNEWIHHT